MGVEQHDFAMKAAQARDLGRDGGVIGVEEARAARYDLIRIRRVGFIQWLAIETGGGTKLSGRLSGIERLARRIAVDVDGGARDRRADRRRAQHSREIVELLDMPIRVLAAEPGRDEP